MTFDLKALIALLATMNKATAVTIVSFIAANILLPVFHISVGPEWQTLAATALFAIVHGIVVWWVPNNKPEVPVHG